MLHSILLSAAPAGSLNGLLIQLSAAVGFLLPLLVAVIQREHWSKIVRVSVSVAAVVGASVLLCWQQGKLNLHDWSASAFAVYLTTQTTYLAVWKSTGIAGIVERATTPGKQGSGSR
jgi:hypothetical protein